MRGADTDVVKLTNAKRTLAENLDVYDQILSKQPFIGGEVSSQRLHIYLVNRMFTLSLDFHIG